MRQEHGWRWACAAAMLCLAWGCGGDDEGAAGAANVGRDAAAEGSDAAAGGSGGAARDASTGPDAAANAPATGCDLRGRWAVQRVGFASVDSPLVSGAQKSTRWYYLEIEQTAQEVTVSRGLWCGDWTTGDATIRYADETTAALRPLASTDGRRGRYVQDAGGCRLSLERIYWVYGVEPRERYLEGVVAPPGRIEGDPGLSELRPMPETADDSVVDTDGDGRPGVRSLIVDTPLGSGVRHGLQRGWEEIEGIAEGSVDDFLIGVRYDFEEIALEAMPEAFKSDAFVRQGAPHAARFVRIDEPPADADDATLCESVQERLPHRPEPRESF